MRQQMGISGEQNQTELSRQDQAGDFAQAYVIAHEVGHHIQNLLGISGKVQQARAQSSQVEGNQLSVRLELQADCFAGIWANQNQQRTQFLEQGDIAEAMDAAEKLVMITYKEKQQVKLYQIALLMVQANNVCNGLSWDTPQVISINVILLNSLNFIYC